MRTRPIMYCALVVFAGAGMFAPPGCQSASSISGAPDMLQQLVGEWTLKQISGQDADAGLPAGSKLPRLSFTKDGGLSGFGGVNQIGGTLDPAPLLRGEMSVGNLTTTRMAGPTALMGLENRFLAALGQVKSFSFDKAGGLNLSDGVKTLLSFVKAG